MDTIILLTWKTVFKTVKSIGYIGGAIETALSYIVPHSAK